MPFLDPSQAKAHLESYSRKDGLSVRELMDSQKQGGLTYNDFLVLPGHIDFPASAVSLESHVTKKTVLKTPFLSSPMDTVTETEMAITMAVSSFWRAASSERARPDIPSPRSTAPRRSRCHPPQPARPDAGRHGSRRQEVRHLSFPPRSPVGVVLERSADPLLPLRRRFENGFITDPVCLSPSGTVADVWKIKETQGFCGIPITGASSISPSLARPARTRLARSRNVVVTRPISPLYDDQPIISFVLPN